VPTRDYRCRVVETRDTTPAAAAWFMLLLLMGAAWDPATLSNRCSLRGCRVLIWVLGRLLIGGISFEGGIFDDWIPFPYQSLALTVVTNEEESIETYD
jgi:hypothetical protein